jgi:ABC-type proline/glycine betaine transport system ATPase subunit
MNLTNNCDSVMTNQNHLIELKDSVIMIQRNELNDLHKKKKRRKIGSIFAGIGLLTLLIVK